MASSSCLDEEHAVEEDWETTITLQQHEKNEASLSSPNIGSSKEEEEEEEEEEGTQEAVVSPKFGLLLFSSLYTFFYCGAFSGWGPMQLLLEDNGAFSDQCHYDNNNATTTTTTTTTCSDQTTLLLRVSFIGQLTILTAPILGSIGDMYSVLTLVYAMVGTVAAGLLQLILAVEYQIDELLFPAFVCLGMISVFGGLLSVQTGLYMYPKVERQRNRVIGWLNALFDAGSITYLGLWAISEGSNLSLTTIVSLYAAMAVVTFGGAFYYWKQVVAAAVGQEQEQHSKLDTLCDDAKHQNNINATLSSSLPLRETVELSCCDDASSNNNLTTIEEPSITTNQQKAHLNDSNGQDDYHEAKKQQDNITRCNNNNTTANSPPFLPVAQRTPREQLVSEPFLWLCLYFALHVTVNNYTLSTTRDFLAYLGDDLVGNQYLAIFTLLLPASILGLPLVDQLVYRFGFHNGGFQVINGLSLCHSLIKLTSDNLNVQVFGFVVFSLLRCCLFSVTMSYVSNLLSPNVAGKGVGIMSFFAGLVCFVNLPLSQLAVERWDGNFFKSNLIMASFVVPCFVAAWRIGTYIKQEEEEHTELTTTKNNTAEKEA